MSSIDLPVNECASPVSCFLTETFALFQASFTQRVMLYVLVTICSRSRETNIVGKFLHQAVCPRNMDVNSFLLTVHRALINVLDILHLIIYISSLPSFLCVRQEPHFFRGGRSVKTRDTAYVSLSLSHLSNSPLLSFKT